jgi:hypothetical protein
MSLLPTPRTSSQQGPAPDLEAEAFGPFVQKKGSFVQVELARTMPYKLDAIRSRKTGIAVSSESAS